MKNDISISLIVPCYNEESNIQKGVLDKIGNYTDNDRRFKEVLIVDDGSTDNSRHIIKNEYFPQFPKFRLIENQHAGKAFAIINGIQQSNAQYVMFTDIDLATPIEESEKLITELSNNYTIVIGSRKSARKGAPLLRKLMSFGSVLIRNILINIKGIKDTQCGFKLFRKEEAQNIISHLKVFHDKQKINGSSVSAGFDLEFLFLAQKLGLKIREVPVTWKHVETRNVNFIHDSIESLKDILRIKLYDLQGKYNT